jgi:hypothetical protein
MAKSVAIIDNKRFDKEQIIISYDHITKQQVLQTASAKCIKTDLKQMKKNCLHYGCW